MKMKIKEMNERMKLKEIIEIKKTISNKWNDKKCKL